MKLGSETKKADTKFDAKAARQILTDENKFISEVWPKLGVPENTKNDDLEYLLPGKASEGKKAKTKIVAVIGDGKRSRRAKSLEDLHERLEALKGKKLGYKEKLVKKGLKNRITKKQKKEEQKSSKSLLKPVKSADTKPNVKPRLVFNSEGKMVFSKFDFTESDVKEEKEKQDKKEKFEKKPQKILQKLQKETNKVKSLENQGDVEKATEMKEKLSWKRALAKAEGKKVKDNPELLKKTIKKEEKKKEKSKQKWKARTETVKKKKEEKQKKRTENIEARKKQVKVNKLKKAAKKGRIIPGF